MSRLIFIHRKRMVTSTGPIHFHYMEESNMDILIDNFCCVLRKKVSQVLNNKRVSNDRIVICG